MNRSGRTAAPGVARSQFFGRQRQLGSLLADVERAGLDTIAGRKAPRARVLLIAGRGGSGRSALAERLVRELADRYRGGVLRARLTEPDGRRVPTEETARALLDALGVAAPPGADADELSQSVREALAGREVLLLLDDAADAEQVDELLPEDPDCLLVAVSGGPLTGIPDVRPCTLGGMDPKAAIELLATFTGSVRITVDPQAAESVAEECAGQPAALVMIGGWLAARPKASVADATKRLRALPDDEDAPKALRPVARAFRLVYESLPQPAARTLRLLSLAPAGLVDAHTASALGGCSIDDARTALGNFVALGVLHRDAVDAADAAAGESYRVPGVLVPLMKSLVDAHDKPSEVQLARARMLERAVRRLQSCRAVTEPEGSPAREAVGALPSSLRFPDAANAADWLRARQPALLAAARVAVEDGELDTLARRLVAALVRALAAHRGTEAAAPELYGLHQLVLGVAERRGLHREIAAALLNLGDLDAQTGRTEDALARYRAALDAGRAARDPYATCRAMESVGGAHQELGDWQRAADWYGRALAQRQTRQERADEARLYGRLGTVHTYAGRYGEALRCWRAAVAGYRKVGDVPSQARALSEAARVQEYAGRPEESLHTCREAVEWARQAGDVRLQAALLLRLADTLDRLGDPAAARLHRSGAERLLAAEEAAGAEGAEGRGGAQATGAASDADVAGGAGSTGSTASAPGTAEAEGAAPTGSDAGTTRAVEGSAYEIRSGAR
ncbi:tetratricopeptide repeat protein [Streptomyces sp. NPDC017979]|uniref:tetratricopeptide repeat protein n=1 Tax=Streptomyces sp. NPDC017979 TaxID=3365024 RepID=UPI00378DD6C9